jgi:hypothetical protein
LRATFFIVADVTKYCPGLVESVVARGHEIACHGLHHAAKLDSKTKRARFTLAEFEERTAKARATLQEVSGQAVEGYRAPSAYIGEWMFESLSKLGFKYDSSVNSNSFFSKADFATKGIGTSPYWMSFGDKKLLEMPWPFWRIGPFRFPAAGGPFLRFFGSSYIMRGLRQSVSNGNAVFYFHSIDLTEKKFPGLASANLRRPFYWAVKGDAVKDRVERVLRSFDGKWTTCGDVYSMEVNA